MTLRTKLATVFTTAMTITLLGYALVSSPTKTKRPPRPLFFNIYEAPEMGRQQWLTMYPICDDHGTLYYYDKPLNILAMLVTSDPSIGPVRARGDQQSTTVGSGTSCAVTIVNTPNRLILVFPSDPKVIEVPLSPEQGSAVVLKFREFRNATNDFDALNMLVDEVTLPDAVRLRIALTER